MTQRKVSFEDVVRIYRELPNKYREARIRFNRPLTLAEKILSAHLVSTESGEAVPTRGETYAFLKPDRVAMQDATAQMALLQFMQVGMNRVAVPTTVHCDHLIQARLGAQLDLDTALRTNNEVYDALRTMSTKYDIGFWNPGAGIIHQVVLEQYAFPGALMIGTDSHTPNAGGLGMLAIGVGGADATFTMAGEPWGVRWPKLIGVKLTGSLSGWASPKDVILKLAGILSVKGGTGAIIEYFGPGARTISATGKATITNMGAELGATTSVFPCDEHTLAYLRHTGREAIAALADHYIPFLNADPEVEEVPEMYFDRVIEIDLDKLEPHIVGPHTPDLARPISEFKEAVLKEGYPTKLRYALIGSCTNSSYEDMTRAAAVANQARAHGIKAGTGFLVTPGSEQVRLTIERDGQMEAFQAIDAQVLANACGPCIGQWKRSDIEDGEANSIITSFNRNFRRRNDGNAETLSFIASPEIVTAFALAGDLAFNPLTDPIRAADGTEFMLEPPAPAGLPKLGFSTTAEGYIEPPSDESARAAVTVDFKPDSERLSVLTPFASWNGEDLDDLLVLLKAEGKCTTDHISPAGAWLRFRGHLDKISDNMFLGANNMFSETAGHGVNVLTGETGKLTTIARQYKAAGRGWVSVGDENYGEGSSREHAAMSPRHLGCRVVIARSFARIHETNLKQQGVLALTFADPADYDLIRSDDRIAVTGLADLAPGKVVTVVIRHADGSTDSVIARHTMTAEQIEWFKEGSALNYIRKVRQSAEISQEAEPVTEPEVPVESGCQGSCGHGESEPRETNANGDAETHPEGCCGDSEEGECCMIGDTSGRCRRNSPDEEKSENEEPKTDECRSKFFLARWLCKLLTWLRLR